MNTDDEMELRASETILPSIIDVHESRHFRDESRSVCLFASIIQASHRRYQANLKHGKRICHCCPLAGLAINPVQPAIQNRPLSSRKHVPFSTRLLWNLHLLVEVRRDEQRNSLEDLLWFSMRVERPRKKDFQSTPEDFQAM